MIRVAACPSPPERPPDGHKGTFGRVLIVAGSRGMSGAAVLSGLGALRGGAGLVYLAAAHSSLPTIAAVEPSYLTIPLEEDDEGLIRRTAAKTIRDRAEGMSAVAIGPGCGRSPGLTAMLVDLYRTLKQPMVVDADALNALSERPEALAEHAGPRILTPHPGEFSRLSGADMEAIAADREGQAVSFAERHGVTLALKGNRTVVTDGVQLYVNTTGNSGMATGGSGDVLTGLLAALIAQRMQPFDAACFGVWLHGLAGDLAAAELSQPGLISSDLPRYLCAAWKQALGESVPR